MTKEAALQKPVIVAVGASAGGLEAFTQLLKGLRDSEELAGCLTLVFVQHLESTGQSLLIELLQKSTDWNVVAIESLISPLGRTIYVCPPKTRLEMTAGRISPVLFDEATTNANPIDDFLFSLADDQGERSIGVILSGSGTDGTMGLKAISDAGGLTFAQEAQSAKFDSMPRSAATTGVADHVLPPEAIAEEVARYVRHLAEHAEYRLSPQRQNDLEEEIPAIAAILAASTHHNFQHYKTSTLTRRIARRMQVLKMDRVDQYVRYLETDNEEIQSLFRDLLIGVTTFFRDPEAFAKLAEVVLPALFAERTSEAGIRIWAAGCADGSEAYTLAILCREAMEKRRAENEVQIFATDIDQRALQIARMGNYPVGIEDYVSADRLKRFFVKRGKRYEVTKEIREMVLFSQHNLISDPPFSRQDLIVCRNLLIYLGSHLQNKLIPLFHYALRPHGYLFLGPSENITSHGELFRPIDAKVRISQRKGTALGSATTISLRHSRRGAVASCLAEPDRAIDLTDLRQRIVLDEFAPRSCVIDADGQVLDASTNLQRYLGLGEGEFQNDIVKMVAPGLRNGLRAAISEAKKIVRKVQHEGLSIRLGEQIQPVMVTVQPMPQVGDDDMLFIVVFHDVGLPLDRSSENRQDFGASRDALNLVETSATTEALINQLEYELETTRTDLERSIQDLEAANEELKSSNEELLSMNEELQSANEELETNKEEIRAGSDAVARANADLENLLRSTRIATVFLDNELRIRSFTPAITEIYDLIPTDIGRPLASFVAKVPEMPPLSTLDQLAPSVLDEKCLHEQREQSSYSEDTIVANSGKSYIRRVLPYQSHTGEKDGLVVTFTDVSRLRESEEQFQLLVEASSQIVWITNPIGEVVKDSPSWRHFTGQTYEQWRGMGWADAIHLDDRDATRLAWERAVAEVIPFSTEYRLKWRGGGYRWTQARAMPQRGPDGTVRRWVGMNIDIHDRKQSLLQLEASQRRLQTFADTVPPLMAIVDADERFVFVNQSYADHWQRPVEDIIGHGMKEIVSEEVYKVIAPRMAKAIAGERVRYELMQQRPETSELMYQEVVYVPQCNETGVIEAVHVVITDMTEIKTAQKQLIEREAHLRRVINNQLGLVGVIDRDGILVEVDDRSLEIAKVRREEVIGKHFADTPWWTYDQVVADQMRVAMNRAFAGEVIRFDVSLFAHGDDGVRIDFMIAPVKNDKGKVEYLIPSGVDIRERHKAELELSKSEHLVRTIAENSTQGLVMMDDSGYVIYCNQIWLDMTGFNSDEIRAKPLHDLVHHHYPDGRPYPMTECPLDRALPEDFSVRAHEDLFFRKDGSTFPVLCSASPIFEEGKPVSTVIEIRDIAEQKHQQEELTMASARLEAAMDFAGIAAWGWNRQRQELVFDSQIKRMWGFDENANVRLDDFTARIDKEHRQRVEASIAIAMRNRTSYREEYLINLPSGQQRWIRAIGHAKASPDGSGLEDFFGVTMDITLERRREIKARFRAELLEELTQLTSPEEIMQAATTRIAGHYQATRCYLARIQMEDATTNVDFESHAEHFSTIVGLHRIKDFLSEVEMDAIKQGIPIRIDDINDAGRREEQIREFEALGIIAITQGSFEATNKLQRTIFVSKDHPYHWRDDEVHFLDNLTEMVYLRIERARAHLELEQARAAAESASQSKSAFVANMSHEIRTPMTAILGYADLIRDRITDEESVEHLRTIRRNGDYLLEIINDILDLSKIEAGKLDISSEPFELAKVIEDVRSIMEVRAREGGLELAVEFDGKLPHKIHSDAKRLKQILINLVGNAIKFTRQGRVRIRLKFERGERVRPVKNGDHSLDANPKLYIDVDDTGIGMNEEQLQKLFRPFTQGDSSVSRHFGGTGLGLAISKRLAEMLGGEITATSALGVGSTFTVSVATGDLAMAEMVDFNDELIACVSLSTGTQATASTEVEPAIDSQRLNCHILVVDDRRDIRFLSKMLLTKAGATVDECEDGQLAVGYLKQVFAERRQPSGDTEPESLRPAARMAPDLILLDMQMPNLDGYETARALRKLGYAGPIIALTADAMQGDMNECLNAGCNDYLSKPIDAALLVAKVARLTRSNLLS